MDRRKLSHRIAVLSGVLLMAAAPAMAAKKSLATAVPEGVYIFVHHQANPEREFLDKHWANVWNELAKANIGADVMQLIKAQQPPADQATFDQSMEQIMALVKSVDWSQLCGKETVFAGKMMFPMPDYVFLTRPDPESLEKNTKALETILNKAADAEPNLLLQKIDLEPGTMWTLVVSGTPVSFTMAEVDGVLVFGLGQQLIGSALDSLRGKESDHKPLVSTDRFKAAFEGLPEAEDTRVMFDMNMMLDGMQQMFAAIPEQKAGDDGGPSEAAQIKKLMASIVDELHLLDYIATVGYTEGLKTHNISKMMLSKDASSKVLYKAMGKPNGVKDYAKFIPQNAKSFSVNSAWDLSALYAGVRGFVKENVPDGEQHIAELDGMQQAVGFNIQDDLLSWIGSKTISVSMPGGMSAMGMGGGEFVMMLEVSDQEKADAKIGGWLTQLNTMLQQNGAQLVMSKATVAGDDSFTSIMSPMMPIIKPVIGVHGGYLIIGSSANAVGSVLATAAGDQPNILDSATFNADGILPTGPVYSISFTDMRGSYRETAQMLGMAGGFGSIIVANLPPEQAQVAQSVLGIITKLAPVIAAMDFYQSEATVVEYDGRKFMTTQVVTYLPYKEPETTEAAVETP